MSDDLDDLRDLIANVVDGYEDASYALAQRRASAIIEAMRAAGYVIKHAPCEECRKVHETYPVIRAYHSPICEARKFCATCKKPFTHHPTGEVGAICAECYGKDSE